MRRTPGLAAAAVALALAGCGDSDSHKKASARGDTGATASGSPSRVPEVLQGTWQATIESSRLVDAPTDLTQEHSIWTLKFLGTGGEGNGPSLVLSNDQVGEVVLPISISGDEITLQSDTDCKRFVHVELGLEKRMIRSTEQQKGCPSTLVSSVLQRPWRLVEGGPSRRGRTSAEVTRASAQAFVECALRRDDLGTVVGLRDGRVVPLPGQDVLTAKLDLRVSAPLSAPSVLADGGQYVGLRGGVGPDVDIVFWGSPEFVPDIAETPLGSFLDEASKTGIVTWSHGDYSGRTRAGDQEFATARLDGEPPGWDEKLGLFRLPRPLKPLVPCFRKASRA
jgi:hypothetical protein